MLFDSCGFGKMFVLSPVVFGHRTSSQVSSVIDRVSRGDVHLIAKDVDLNVCAHRLTAHFLSLPMLILQGLKVVAHGLDCVWVIVLQRHMPVRCFLCPSSAYFAEVWRECTEDEAVGLEIMLLRVAASPVDREVAEFVALCEAA